MDSETPAELLQQLLDACDRDGVVVTLDAEGKHQRQPAKVRDYEAKSGSSIVETNGRSFAAISSWERFLFRPQL